MKHFLLAAITLAVIGATTFAQSNDRIAGAITGRVIRAGGQPFANIAVIIRRVGGIQASPGITTTDDDGKFRVDDLAPGVYSVFASVPEYVTDRDANEPQYYRPGDTVR